MSSEPSPIRGELTLEQLIALNEELAALVRAGIPLEESLVELARDMPGRMGDLAWSLGTRLRAGENLSQILASDPRTFPPVWRAVVEAGVRSGNLAAALEGLTAAARRLRELRQTIGVRCIYPLIVLALAYALFVGLVVVLAPLQLRFSEDVAGVSDPVLRGMAALGGTAVWWAVPFPVLVGLLLAWFYRRWKRLPVSRRGSGSLAASAYHDARLAAFADLLSTLLRHAIPLPEALALAGDASGDTALQRAAQASAVRLRAGQSLREPAANEPTLPPMLRWLVTSPGSPEHLAAAVARIADRYRQRAVRRATRLAIAVPLFLTTVVAGTATLLQGLAVLTPLYRLLFNLSV